MKFWRHKDPSRWRIVLLFLVIAVLLHAVIFSVSFRHVIWPQSPPDSSGFARIELPRPVQKIPTSPFVPAIAPPSLYSGGNPVFSAVTNITLVSFPPPGLPAAIISNRPQVDIFPNTTGAFAVPNMANEFMKSPPFLGPRPYEELPFTVLAGKLLPMNFPHVRLSDVRQTQPTHPVLGQ